MTKLTSIIFITSKSHSLLIRTSMKKEINRGEIEKRSVNIKDKKRFHGYLITTKRIRSMTHAAYGSFSASPTFSDRFSGGLCPRSQNHREGVWRTSKLRRK